MISRLQSATNRFSAAAAVLLLGGSRSRSEIDFTGSIGLPRGCEFILPGGAAAQKSTRNSEPNLLDDRILRQYAHASKRPGNLLQSVSKRSFLGRALEWSNNKW